MEARLALRTSEERARALHGRADQLDRSAAARARGPRPGRRAARAADPRGSRRRGGRWPPAESCSRRLDRSVDRAAAARAEVEQARARPRGGAAGRPRRGCATWPASTTSWSTPSTATRWPAPSRGCASSSSRSGRSRSSASSPTALVADYGPEQPVPFTGTLAEGERRAAEPTAYVREEQQKRLRAAERELALLGRVNPLALEEFTAMEERHKFLTEQLEDLKKTRKDLLDIVQEVDARVQRSSPQAYADVAKAFDHDLRPAVPRRRGPAGPHRPERHARPPASRSRPARPARRSSGSRCSPAVSARWSRWRSWSRCSRPARRRSTSSTRSRRRSTTPTSAGCWRSTRSCARTPSCS